MAGGKKGCLLVLVIIVVAGLFLLYPSIQRTRAQLLTLDEQVKAAWSQLENHLQSRMDLVPNYVEIIKSYAPHEREVFGAVTQLHVKAAVTMLRSNKIAVNNDLTAALDRLRVVTERYPDLMADQTFIRLRDELAGIEARIAEECIRYNEAVGEYNAYREGFPADIVAPFSGFGKAFPMEAPGKGQAHQRSSSDPALPSSDNR